MEIITGIERRRRWGLAEKLRIVAETEQPGAGIAELARRYEISRGLLWNWRSQVRRGMLKPERPSMFLPVRLLSESTAPERRKRPEPGLARTDSVMADSTIEITLSDGTAIRVGHDVSLVTLRRVMAALRR